MNKHYFISDISFWWKISVKQSRFKVKFSEGDTVKIKEKGLFNQDKYIPKLGSMSYLHDGWETIDFVFSLS